MNTLLSIMNGLVLALIWTVFIKTSCVQVAEMTGAKIDELKALIKEHK